MKPTGITRKIDELGRLVLPKELRDMMDVGPGDAMEIFRDDEGGIVLRKYAPGCMLCGSLDKLQIIDGNKICIRCANRISDSLRRW